MSLKRLGQEGSLKQKAEKDVNPEVVDGKFLAVISYVGPFCLLGLMASSDNSYVQFHAKQGLILFILWVLFYVIKIIPILGRFIFFLGALACFALMIIGIKFALSGEQQKLPIIGELINF